MDQNQSNGALIGSFVIVIILIIGGIYLMKTQVEERRNETNGAAAEEPAEFEDLSDIEAELDANSDFDSLDNGLE